MRILFWTLVHLGVVLSSQVTIEYNKPVLKLTLPSLFTSSDVGHVIFRYTIDNVQKQGVGVLITEGWQYQTSDVSLDGAHEVSADAVIYNTKGNLKDATEKSTLKLAIFGECTQSGNNGCSRTGGSEILPPIMSGKIKSVPTLRFGTLEVRARIPSGDWLWSAIWMVPTDRVYGAWPRSGEIDIMESKGNPGASGVGKVTSTLNWGPSADQNRKSTTHGEKHAANWHTQFHTWRLEWTPDHILTFVDNQQIMSVVPPDGGFWQKGGFSGTNLWSTGSKIAPFDQDFLLIFNVAVGATDGYFPDGNHYGNVTKPWDNHSPHPMLDFWKAQSAWLPTWQGENAALVIDWVEFKTL